MSWVYYPPPMPQPQAFPVQFTENWGVVERFSCEFHTGYMGATVTFYMGVIETNRSVQWFRMTKSAGCQFDVVMTLFLDASQVYQDTIPAGTTAWKVSTQIGSLGGIEHSLSDPIDSPATGQFGLALGSLS